MRQFEQYLLNLRRSLDVDPRRAEEVCAEVRGHLEERAAQFRDTGLSPDEAAEAAVRSFGDPERMGATLSAANSTHRLLRPWRAVLALGLVVGAMAALIGSRRLLLFGMSAWLTENTPLLAEEGNWLLLALCAAPAAVLAGMVAGRRGWCIAGIPPFLWGVVLWVISLAQQSITWYSHSIRETFAGFVAWPLGGAALLAACGAFGARIAGGKSAGRVIAAVCWAYVLGVSVAGVLMDVHDAAGIFATIAVIEAVLGLIGIAALWASPTARRHTLPVAAAAWVVCVGAMTNAVAHPTGYYHPALKWAAIAVVQAVAALVVLYQYRTSDRRARQSESSARIIGEHSKSERVRYDI